MAVCWCISDDASFLQGSGPEERRQSRYKSRKEAPKGSCLCARVKKRRNHLLKTSSFWSVCPSICSQCVWYSTLPKHMCLTLLMSTTYVTSPFEANMY